MNGAHDELVRSEPNMVTLDYLMCRTDKKDCHENAKTGGLPVQGDRLFFCAARKPKRPFLQLF